MKKINLQTRFFVAYFLMALLFVLFFSLIFHRYTSNILIERETKSLSDLNSTFLSQVEAVINDMDTVSINIGYSNLMKDKLYDMVDLNVASDDFKNLANLFTAINGADLKVDQINLYDFNGRIIQTGIKSNTHPIDLSTLEWLELVCKNKGAKTISLPYATTDLVVNPSNSKAPAWYLSLYRTYINRYKKETGVIETVKKCSSVFKAVDTYQKKTAQAPDVYIYNQDKIQVYPYATKEAGEELPYASLACEDSGNIFYRNKEKGQKEILAYEHSSYTGWLYVTVQQEQLVLEPVRRLNQLLVFIVCISLVFSAGISYYFSRRLVSPIRQLRHIIRKTALETLGEEAVPLSSSFDELEELNQEFSSMSMKLKTSMDNLITTKQEEAKSRSLALQSQINPHFYYNTLSSIIVLAENGQTDEVITMCRNLTKIMRYITGNTTPQVTLLEEIDYVREYLYCMKIRYQSSLNYEISIAPEILTEKIPKLIIQPLVENALKYGTDCKPPWYLSIQSHVSTDSWTIEILDSGNGFSEEALEKITRLMKNADENPGLPTLHLDGLGLLNVYLRWKLFAGEGTIFTCKNTKEGHALVTIGRKFRQ